VDLHFATAATCFQIICTLQTLVLTSRLVKIHSADALKHLVMNSQCQAMVVLQQPIHSHLKIQEKSFQNIEDM